jgi:hypothetical protein
MESTAPSKLGKGILQKKDVSSCAAAGVGFIEETGVHVGAQDHITRPVHNAVCWIGSSVV